MIKDRQACNMCQAEKIISEIPAVINIITERIYELIYDHDSF